MFNLLNDKNTSFYCDSMNVDWNKWSKFNVHETLKSIQLKLWFNKNLLEQYLLYEGEHLKILQIK
jgi:hypothetical protein